MISPTAASWRSLLYVPGNNARFLAKAQERGADALILDLEDSVPDSCKNDARAMVAARIPELRQGPSDLLVRINAGLRHAVADLEVVVQPGLQAVFVPKCNAPEKLVLLAELIGELEVEGDMPGGSVGLVAMIETPRGLEAVMEIAKAHERLCALVLGSEDFATACGMQPLPEALLHARQKLVFAARAASIVPLGLLDSVANYSDTSLAASVQRSKQFGFSGATAVHPGAVATLNAEFCPSADELSWARRVVTAMEEALRSGRGAASLHGRMIDKPVYRRAQAILDQVR